MAMSSVSSFNEQPVRYSIDAYNGASRHQPLVLNIISPNATTGLQLVLILEVIALTKSVLLTKIPITN